MDGADRGAITKVINGIFWCLRTGAPWRDLPRRYGPWQTVYERFNRWCREGLWRRILQALQAERDRDGRLDWDLWCIDGSSIRGSRAAAGARPGQGGPAEPADHALGRSRGGFGTKVHIVCDSRGTPLALCLSPGQAHESRYLEPVMTTVRVTQPRGRSRWRPRRLAGDKSYSYPRVRRWLRRHHIAPVIPEREDQKRHRCGRPPAFDREAYRRRNVVERLIGWLKEARRLATRFEKLALTFEGMFHVAMIGRLLRTELSDGP